MASKGKKAVVLKGKEIAAEIRAEVAAEIAQLKEKTPNFQPRLTIVQVWSNKFTGFRVAD